MSYSARAKLVYGVPLKGRLGYSKDPAEGSPAHIWSSDKPWDGVTVIGYGCVDPSSFIVGINTSVAYHDGDYCEPASVTVPSPETIATWEAKIRAYVAKFSVETTGAPGWYLAASYE
jgi:hypothetical protein